MKHQRNQVASRNKRTAIIQRLGELYPDMVVFAGPFEIRHPWQGTRDREVAHVTQMKEAFQAAKVPVLVVESSVGAWLLRSKSGLQTGPTVQLEKYAMKLRTRKGALRA